MLRHGGSGADGQPACHEGRRPENVEAYLESRGAWVTHLGDDRSEEVEEFHVDYIYNTDTHAITDVQVCDGDGQESQ